MASQCEQLRRAEGSLLLEVVPEEEPRTASAANPMEVDVILSNMFGYLDFKDLGHCRRVSKQWFQVSLPAWLAKAPTLKITLDQELEKEIYKAEDIHLDMITFLQLAHNELHSYDSYEFFGLRQYRKFSVAANTAINQVQHYHLQQFIRIYGHCVTELELGLEIPDFETYRALMLSTRTPNLVKLNANIEFAKGYLQPLGDNDYEPIQEDQRQLTSLQIYCRGGWASRDDCSRLPAAGWIQLLKRYPNLKTLLLDVGHEVEDTALEGILEVIGNIRQSDKTALDLRRLEICYPLADRLDLLPHFRNAKLSLDTLGLPIGKHTPPQAVCDILTLQRPTLKKLSIHNLPPLDAFTPPELPLLQSLGLYGMVLPNLSSLKNFPNLQSLFLEWPVGGVPSSFDVLRTMLRATATEDGGLILPTLSKLHYHYSKVPLVRVPLQPEDVGKLARFFPNLRDLQLWLTNRTLAAVVQSWPDLQHLTIIGIGVNDDGIDRVAPHLPGMRGLKSLVMRQYDDNYDEDAGPTSLSEKSLVKFLELPNLERLEVTLAAKLDLHDDILRKVEAKIKTCKLTQARKWDAMNNNEANFDPDEDDGSDDDDDGSYRSSSSDGEGGGSDNEMRD